MVDVTCTPSSVTVLVEVRVQPIEHLRNSSMLPDSWELLGPAPEDIDASVRAEIHAGTALDMARCTDLPSLLGAVILVLSFEWLRQLALDTWLASWSVAAERGIEEYGNDAAYAGCGNRW